MNLEDAMLGSLIKEELKDTVVWFKWQREI